jgi:hypothetical protein
MRNLGHFWGPSLPDLTQEALPVGQQIAWTGLTSCGL